MLVICLCNDVVVIKNIKTGAVDFHGPSTDEITLLNTAKSLGFELI